MDIYQVHPLESRWQSVAWGEESPSPLPNEEVGSQMGRTILNITGHLPCCLSPLTSTDMENTQHLPHFPIINLSGDCQTQAKFCKSTLWGDRQWRRIWSGWDSLTLGIPCLMFLSHILEGILLCREHLETQEKSPTCSNSPHVVQATKWSIKVAWCELHVLKLPP